MKNFLSIALFLVIALAGYFCVAVIANLAIVLGAYPQITEPAHIMSFQLWLGGGGMWVWIVAAVAGIGSFFAGGGLRKALLFAPLYMPALYAVTVIFYFYFLYKA